MSIVTFYSYKGGVGRSMALANIAFELAKRGKKVLIVDWDLEAPGLEKYFSNYSIDNIGNGLLALLLEVDTGQNPDYTNFLWSIKIDSHINISFLPSGREKDPNNFSLNLEKFDWNDFFKKNGGGAFMEKLRLRWHKDFDLVLIDSRTGLSDSSGICTIFLPDIIIPLFTANYQSLYGVRDIMRYAQNARNKLGVERMALTILPIPTRFGTRVEFKESQEWLDRFASVLKEFYGDWLPKWIEPKHVLEQIKIPQIDYFSFGEKLAVAEQGTNDPEGMGYIYSKIAGLLASDFEDLSSFVGIDFYNLRKAEYEKNQSENIITKGVVSEEYEYDVFISHAHSTLSSSWINEFGAAFIEFLTDELGYSPKIFVDIQEISVGSTWSDLISNALKKSKCLLVLLSPDYFTVKYSMFEIEMFLEQEKRNGMTLITPVLLKPLNYETLPIILQQRELVDFSEFNIDEIKKSSRQQLRFAQKVERLAQQIAIIIKGKQYFNLETPAKDGKDSANNVVKLLSGEYEDLRKSMRSGNERTRLLQYVFEKMKNNANKVISILNNLIGSDSEGEKLFAIAALHMEPNLDYLEWLSNRVGDNEKSFVGFQASVALYLLSKKLGKNNKQVLIHNIDKALLNIRSSTYVDPNQISILETARTELSFL